MTTLTARDLEVLEELCAATDMLLKIARSGWCTPMECGGHNGSDHSYRLSKLARCGAAEQKARSNFGSRGSKLYRITPTGRLTLECAAR